MLANYDAIAYISGNRDYPGIMGTVGFKAAQNGTWVDADIKGLPDFAEATEDKPQIGPFGFHVHKGDCDADDGHFDTGSNPHGNHTGDMPVLFQSDGRARLMFFTNRFKPADVIGRSAVIHLSPDDYKTQPAGGSGEIIACGTIEKAE